MTNKPIVYFDKYPLKFSELLHFGETKAAVFATSCHAINEINVFARLYVSDIRETPKEPEMAKLYEIQSMTILRSWSAKLFEYHEFIKCVRKLPEFSTYSKLLGSNLKKFNQLKKMDGFIITRKIRNEMTSHYDLKKAQENLKNVAPHAEATLYFHELDGNSFFPISEEVMFWARADPQSSAENSKHREEYFKKWSGWALKARDWAYHCHGELIGELVTAAFPGRQAKPRSYYLEMDDVCDVGETRLPLVLRKRQ